MTKKNNENFKNCTKCWIYDNGYNDNDVKVRDDYHIAGKYRASAHKAGNINPRLNHKILVVFHNLKKPHTRTRQIDLKINVIPNGLEKYMSFTINNNEREYQCVLNVWNKLEIKKWKIIMTCT